MRTKLLLRTISKQEELEQTLMDEFARENGRVSKRTETARLKAQKISYEPHQIKKAREFGKKLTEYSESLSQIIEEMETTKENTKYSSELRAYLLQEIALRKADQDTIENAQKEVHKSEKCGAAELEKISKEKELWTNTTFGALFATVSAAAALVSAPSSGQSLCVPIFLGILSFTLLAAAKVTVVGEEYKILDKSIEDGDYWCNRRGPQRPGTIKGAQSIWNSAKGRIQKRLHL